MPSIKDSLTSNIPGFSSLPIAEPIFTPSMPVSGDLNGPQSIRRSPTLRSPVPQIGTVSPDTLRQFYLPSIPQYRITL